MQLFPRSLNKLPMIGAAVAGIAGAVVTAGITYYLTPKNFNVGYAPTQPVPYSHQLHAGQMGMDCRYCHANVEKAAHAQIPPTQTCMGCHALVKTESPRLANIRSSWETGQSVEWVKIHKLPDHSYFNHSVHVKVGVGCATCHGRIDQMVVVRQDQPLNMGWCLDCHRNPSPNLRPPDQVTNMSWKPEDAKDWTPPKLGAGGVNPPQNCSGCHR
jgi:Cytochrome c7 and related cytochrome c